MIKKLFDCLYFCYSELHAARLERSSFCEEARRAKKREWKTDKAAIKSLVISCYFKIECDFYQLQTVNYQLFL